MNTMTPKEIAAALDTDPKTCRRFLRSLTTERAGKGGRWAIDASMIDEIADRFDAYRNRTTATITAETLDD